MRNLFSKLYLYLLLSLSIIAPAGAGEIKAVIFDFGEVMVDWDEEMLLVGMAQELGLPMSAVAKMASDPRVEGLIVRMMAGDISEQMFWETIAQQLGIDLPENWKSVHRFVTEAITAPREEMFDLVDTLQANGLRTPLLSNVTEWSAEYFDEMGWYAPFSPTVLSYKSGMVKPDHTIYHHTLSMLYLEPEECVFVDDLEENIEAAQAIGMHAILYTSSEELMEELQALGCL